MDNLNKNKSVYKALQLKTNSKESKFILPLEMSRVRFSLDTPPLSRTQ